MSEYDVFLSHNSADKPAVEELARRLVKEGIQPWLDTWNLIPGQPWQEAIEEALERCATCAVFVGPSGTGPWQNEEMRAAIDRRVRESGGRFRVIPVLLPGAERGERGRLPTFLVATTWVEFRRSLDDEDAFHRLACGIRGVEPGPGPGQAIYEGECPYRGLQFFDVEHAPFFFGREALIEWLLNELRGDNRFLAIIGPSGSGKSSLARAGLVAALKWGAIKESAEWPMVICRPGTDPLESLAVALSHNTSDALALISRLSDDERALHITARMALREAPPEHRLVVLVDQFEEVFTLCHDERLREALIDNLLYASSVAEGQTMVLLTMRADFYSKCAAYPTLAAALSDHQLLVGPMMEDELRRAIERPAQLGGCEFEPGLVELLLRDVQDQPGGLPLLQHALLELWGQRDGRRLTHAAYQSIGGVEGALERRAEAVYGQFSGPEQEICRRVFLRLTQPGEGTEDTKRRASLQELLPVEGRQETIQAVVQRLASAEARLVTTEGGASPGEEYFVEVAHEALIRGWSRLREWIEQDREALRVHRRLTEAAREWEENEGDESFLYRGARLAEAEEWAGAHAADLNPLERDFLQASIQAREARRVAGRRRVQWIIAGLATAMMIFAGLALLAFQERNNAFNAQATAEARRLEAEDAQAEADAERREAERAQADAEAQRDEVKRQQQIGLSRQLAAQALNHLDDQLDLALLLSLEANYITDTVEAKGSLLDSIAYNSHLITFLQGHSVAFSPNGQMLASGSTDNSIILWDVASRRPIGQPLTGHAQTVSSLTFSPDGKILASGSWDEAIILWDVATGQQVGQPLTNNTGPVNIVSFSSDGRTLAAGSNYNIITLWDLETRHPLVLPLTGHSGWVQSIAFSPDGQTLAWGSSDGKIVLWDLENRHPLVPAVNGHTSQVTSLTFSPDSQVLASGSCAQILSLGVAGECRQGEIRFWDTETGEAIGQPLTGHVGFVFSLTYSPDGQMLASGSRDGPIILWDVAKRQAIGTALNGHTSTVGSLAFSPDGQMLASGSSDDTIILWDLAADQVLYKVLTGHISPASSVTFSPDGRTLVSRGGYGDSTVILWDVATSQRIEHSLANLTTVAFSPDGQMLALGSTDGTITLWDQVAREAIGQPLTGHTDAVTSLAFSPDGQMLASGSADYTFILWDVETDQPIDQPLATTGSVGTIIFSPDGQMLLTLSSTGYGDKTATLWDVKTRESIGQPLTTDIGNIYSVAFSPNSAVLVSGTSDGTITLWDVATGQALDQLLMEHSWQVSTISLSSPDGQILALRGPDRSIILWDVATGQPIGQPLTGHTGPVADVAFSPNGQVLASGGGFGDNTLILWDVETGQPIGQPLIGHEDQVTSVAFSPDGQTVASSSYDKTIRLWDVSFDSWKARACRRANRNLTYEEWQKYLGNEPYRKTCPKLPEPPQSSPPTPSPTPALSPTSTPEIPILEPTVLSGHDDEIWGLAFSSDGNQLASASYDGTVRLWDPITGTELAVLEGHEGSVIDVSFSPDGKRLATASGTDKTARLWDLENLSEIAVLPAEKSGVAVIRWSPDGQQLATGDADGNVIIWDGITGKALMTLSGHEGIVYAVTFSPDGEKLASASADGTARVWDANTGAELAMLSGHQDAVLAVAFSPDGRRLATSGKDGDTRLWDVNSGKEWAILRGQLSQPSYSRRNGPVQDVVFSPSGDKVVTACANGTARVWDAITSISLITLRGHDGNVISARFSPDGRHIITASTDGTARLWDAESGEMLAVLGGATEPIYRAMFSPDGTLAATAGADGRVRVYSLNIEE